MMTASSATEAGDDAAAVMGPASMHREPAVGMPFAVGATTSVMDPQSAEARRGSQSGTLMMGVDQQQPALVDNRTIAGVGSHPMGSVSTAGSSGYSNYYGGGHVVSHSYPSSTTNAGNLPASQGSGVSSVPTAFTVGSHPFTTVSASSSSNNLKYSASPPPKSNMAYRSNASAASQMSASNPTQFSAPFATSAGGPVKGLEVSDAGAMGGYASGGLASGPGGYNLVPTNVSYRAGGGAGLVGGAAGSYGRGTGRAGTRTFMNSLPSINLEHWVNVYNRGLKRSTRIQLNLGFLLMMALTLLLVMVMPFEFGTKVIFSAMLVSLLGLSFAFWLLAWILRHDEGAFEMREIAACIKEGSEGFFAVQYGTITQITFIFAGLIFLLYFFREGSSNAVATADVSTFSLGAITALTFVFGALCSALSGYSGMWVSVRTNVRVAAAARKCCNDALRLCFRGGAFSSVINVGLAVGGISMCMIILTVLFPSVSLVQLPLLLVGYGFGASLVAMFAQLGGGIYTKAADVGADLVGKVEAGIPEDDSRNPAVIADLVGDNVGDCAGQCADLFESISAEIIAAMILGGALAQEAKMGPREAAGFVLFPLAVHSMDLVVSSIGVMLVRCRKGLPSSDLTVGGAEIADPLKIMIQAYLITCLLGTVCFAGLCRVFLYSAAKPHAWKYYACCGVVGMVCAFLFVLITRYYTDYEFCKVRRIAEASTTGPATNIISGLAVGMESTALPVLLISSCVLIAYYLGIQTDLLPHGKVMSGLFGTAVATMGMLCTAVFVLSMSSFGPIADNAGGIVEMSQQSDTVRAITDRLDAVGNVTKANTKGFSVGSASLACFLLFSAFLDEVSVYTRQAVLTIDLSMPEVFIGGLLGSAMVFLFCAWAMEAVGRAAQEVVKEVRRQFKEFPGIMDFSERPDYHTCVTIVSRAALREMIRPGLLSILSPIIVGFVFRAIGEARGAPQLGAQAIAAFLMFCTSTGILMALFLNNGGGAWDNAKKYIETGAFGGKGSDAHKAAVVGDTVGDPCKDTAGPSVHVLIKLVSTVTMVLTPVFVSSVMTSTAMSSDGAVGLPLNIPVYQH